MSQTKTEELRDTRGEGSILVSLSRAEMDIIQDIRTIGYGKVTIIVQASTPIRKEIAQSIKVGER